MSDPAHEAAVGVVDDLAAEFAAEAPAAAEETPAGSQEETVAEAEAQHETVTEEEIPEDIRALLDEPDFEEEAAAEIQAETTTDDEVDYSEYEDPAVANERKKRLAAEKKAAWLESRIVAQNSKKWMDEAQRYFPYADHSAITPQSRRQVLREAEAQHERNKAIVERALASERAKLEQQTEAERAVQKDEQRAAWGKPLAGPGGPPPSAQDKVARVKAVNAGRGLRDTISARLKAGEVNLGMTEGGETNG